MEKNVFFEGNHTADLPNAYSVNNKELLALLRNLQKFEVVLQNYSRPGTDLKLSNMLWAKHMLDDFIKVETKKIEALIIRVFEEETWEKAGRHAWSCSVQDVFTFLTHSIESYFEVRLPMCIYDSRQ